MKLTDLALVFTILFVAGAVTMDLSLQSQEALVYSRREYDHVIDRVCMDAMTDALLYEGDRAALLDEGKLLGQFSEELFFLLGGISSEEKLHILSGIRGIVITQKGYYKVFSIADSPAEDFDPTMNSMSYAIDGTELYYLAEESREFSTDAVMQDLQKLYPGYMSVAEQRQEAWYQNIDAYEMYVVFADLPIKIPEANGLGNIAANSYTRIVRSAGRIEKR